MKSSAGSSAPKRRTAAEVPPSRAARRARVLRGARRSDVRPAGRGLPADITRVFTLMMAGSERPIRSWRHRAPRAVAPRQDRRRSPSTRAQHLPRRAVRAFIEKLKATPDGDGSLLDHSLILYGSGMSNEHAPRSAAAAGGGRARRGRASASAACRHARRSAICGSRSRANSTPKPSASARARARSTCSDDEARTRPGS